MQNRLDILDSIRDAMALRAGPLDVCLRLTAGNRISARNAALACAAQIIDAGRGLSAWHLAELVRQAVNRFENLTLPRLRRGVAGTLTPLDSALRDAFAAGAAPLRSRQRIYGVISLSNRSGIASDFCEK